MGRPLGRYALFPRLPVHKEDHDQRPVSGPIKHPKAIGGYTLGILTDIKPFEAALPTGGEKFAEGRRGRQRMAGDIDILNLELTHSPGTPEVMPLPLIGSAELRAPEVPT